MLVVGYFEELLDQMPEFSGSRSCASSKRARRGVAWGRGSASPTRRRSRTPRRIGAVCEGKRLALLPPRGRRLRAGRHLLPRVLAALGGRGLGGRGVLREARVAVQPPHRRGDGAARHAARAHVPGEESRTAGSTWIWTANEMVTTQSAAPRAGESAVRRSAGTSRSSARRFHGKPLVYLDNAATSQKPPRVLDAIRRLLRAAATRTCTARSTPSAKRPPPPSRRRGARSSAFSAPRSRREIVFTRGHHRGHQPGGAELGPRQTSGRAT